MKFRITIHSGFGAPPSALDQLAEALGARKGDAWFASGVGHIVANWGDDVPVSMERDEREERGREAVLELLGEVCEGTPELRLDWFAVSPQR